MTFMMLAGSNVEKLVQINEQTRAAIADGKRVLRSLRYYNDQNANMYWTYVEREFPDFIANLPRHVGAMHGSAHHLWMSWFSIFCQGPWTQAAELTALQGLTDAHVKGMGIAKYGDLLQRLDGAGELMELDRAPFRSHGRSDRLRSCLAAWARPSRTGSNDGTAGRNIAAASE